MFKLRGNIKKLQLPPNIKNQHHRDHVDQAARFPAWRLQRSSQRRDGLYLRHGACNYQNVHSLRICVNVCVRVCVFFLSLISLQTRHFLLELWLTTLLRSWLRGEIISSFLWIDIWDQRSKLVQNSSSSAQIYHWMEFPVTRVNQDYWHSMIQSSLDKTEPDSSLVCMSTGHWPSSTLKYQTLQGKSKKLTRVLRTLFSKIRSTVQIVLGRPHSTSVDIQHKQLLDIPKYTQRSFFSTKVSGYWEAGRYFWGNHC